MLKNHPVQTIMITLAVTLAFWAGSRTEPQAKRLTSVIVQAQDSASAKEAVRRVGRLNPFFASRLKRAIRHNLSS